MVLIYNGALMVVELFNVVVPDTFNDDVHVVVLFYIVVPDMYNDVFIDVPDVFKRIASHEP